MALAPLLPRVVYAMYVICLLRHVSIVCDVLLSANKFMIMKDCTCIQCLLLAIASSGTCEHSVVLQAVMACKQPQRQQHLVVYIH